MHLKEIQCKKTLTELDMERIKFSINSEASMILKKIIEFSEKEQAELLMEELRQLKERNAKLLVQSQKKEEIIKKLSTSYKSSGVGSNKKIKK